MAIPDRSRLKEALIEYIKYIGGKNLSVTPSQAYKGLAAVFQLSAEDLAKERDWESLWPNEVRWARQELVAEGILLPRDVSGYGVWKLNDRASTSGSGIKRDPSAPQRTEIDLLYDDLVEEGIFDPMSISDARDIVLRAIVQRRGQQQFRETLLREYNRRCAITGESSTAVLEAAHIVPYSGIETNHIQNGLLLRSDIHTLFDLYLISIDQNFCINIAPSLAGSGYQSLQGKGLSLPTSIANHPSKTALEQHRSHCEY